LLALKIKTGHMFNYNSFFNQSLQALKDAGRYRYFTAVNKSAQHFPVFHYINQQGVRRSAINWCSNDYLCMSTHEDVIAKLSATAHRSGTGSSGTRNISGTTNYHQELEQTLANWHKKNAALLFGGAYAANVTTLQTLGKHIPGLVFVSDERNHASIIEGIRGCKNEKKIFKHNDVAHLEATLKSIAADKPKIIVFESVYSMSGDIAPMQEIVALAKKYNALTYVDEVHGVGLYGSSGAGVAEQEDLQQQIDIINGTLSKAIGVFGGYIAADEKIIDFIRSYGSGFIFTTSLPPAVCSAANKSIQLIQQDVVGRKNFHQQVQLLRTALQENGVAYTPNASHITRVPVSGAQRCKEVADILLQQQGAYLQPINFPTVPEGEECLRIIITNKHLPRHIQHLAYSLQKILSGEKIEETIFIE
jgi:5-aminolevulinate synthase